MQHFTAKYSAFTAAVLKNRPGGRGEEGGEEGRENGEDRGEGGRELGRMKRRGEGGKEDGEVRRGCEKRAQPRLELRSQSAD